MLNLNINENTLKKLKNAKTRIIAGGLGILTVLTMSGCSSKKNENTNTQPTTVKVSTEGEVKNYTLEKFNEKVSVLTNDLDGKFYLTDDDKKTVITILNIDYILTENKDLLNKIYPQGLNSDKEMKDYSTFISKYREYNTEIDKVEEFLTLSQYTEKSLDKEIIEKLESLTKELIELVKTNGYKSRINEIFDLMNKFYDNKDITVNGTVINKDDLSNGFNLGSEVFGQIISVYTKDIVSQEKREELDKKLQAQDRVNRVYTLLEKFGNTDENVINAYVEGNDTYVLDESDKAIINEYNTLCNTVLTDLTNRGIKVTEEEVEAAVTIANVDYFASDYVSAGALKSIIEKREIEDILVDTTVFVNKVENYNKKNEDTANFYKYNIFMNVSNEEQVINNVAIRGALLNTFNLRQSIGSEMTKQDVLNNTSFQAIKLYNQYSSDVTIKGKDGKVVTKNDTGMGTRYITDAIYYKALKELPHQFKSINELVDNTDKENSSINNISWAIDNKCSEYEFVK